MFINRQKHTVFFYAGLVCLFITCLFLGDALLSEHLAYRFPFVNYGGTFRWSKLQIGNLKISLYWSANIFGTVMMCILCVYRKEYCKLNSVKAIATGIMLAVFGFIGAKVLFIIENIDNIIRNHMQIGWGGVSFFGTVFFMPIVIPVMGKIMKAVPRDYLDYCTPAGIIMLASIRLGCFMRGCCQGLQVWVDNKPLIYPAQMIECALDLFLLDYVLKLEKKNRYSGGRYFIFMGGYGIIRFFVEFLRNTPKSFVFLSNGQCFSIVCIMILTIYLIGKRRALR